MPRLRSGRCAVDVPPAPDGPNPPGDARAHPPRRRMPHRAPDRPRSPSASRRAGATTQQPKTPERKARGQYQQNTPSRPKRLRLACRAVAEGMSLRAAAYAYNVRKSTLSDECRQKHSKGKGRPTSLSVKEEAALVDHLLVQADWGFPVQRGDVCALVKHYLDSSGKTVQEFDENRPGRHWVSNFLERHPNLMCKVARQIKTARAKVSPEAVSAFFDNLEASLHNVPPENIANFDETSVADTPAQKMLILRRSEKHPVNVLTSSKSATSVMFCGTAAGHLFPPYVVYKSKELYESWTTGGPPGTRYNRSKSGWFDHNIFEEWFTSIILPWARRTDGTKVVIGDNVSSHFSPKVLELCEKYDIRFICLPTNSTHLLQPLDVAFFGPLKTAWKRILLEWKEKDSNRHLTLPKPQFPVLLKKLVDAIAERSADNLRSAFRATGIVPLDRLQVLKRMPGGVESPGREEVYRRVSDSVLKQLKEKRYGAEPNRRQGKRLKVSPGKSWAPEDLETIDEEEEEVDDPGEPSEPSPKRRVPARRALQRELDGNGVEENFQPTPGDWVLVKFAGKRNIRHSIGHVECIDGNYELLCNFVIPTDKAGVFMWPSKPISKSVDYSDVEKVLDAPKKLKKKGAPLKFSDNLEGFVIA